MSLFHSIMHKHQRKERSMASSIPSSSSNPKVSKSASLTNDDLSSLMESELGKGYSSKRVTSDLLHKIGYFHATPQDIHNIYKRVTSKQSQSTNQQNEDNYDQKLFTQASNNLVKKTEQYSSDQKKIARKYQMNPQDIIPDLKTDGFNELKQMIGLDSVKTKLRKIIINTMVDQQARKLGQRSKQEQSLNMIFMGAPGTGKTSVARLVGKILFQHHVIKKPLLYECHSKDLIGTLVGSSAIKTARAIKRAKGGVLFIDEAYSLASTTGGGAANSGKHSAIDELLSVENDHINTVVILAGYKDKMEKLLNKSNEGLSSRFPFQIVFPDYTDPEMYQIFKYHANLEKYTLTDDVKKQIKAKLPKFDKEAKSQRKDSNGRLMRNLLGSIAHDHKYRIGKNISQIPSLTLAQIDTFSTEDVDQGFQDQFEQLDQTNAQ